MVGQWELPQIDSQLFEIQFDPRQISTDQEYDQQNKPLNIPEKSKFSITMNPFLIISSMGRRQINLDFYDFLLIPDCWMIGLYDGHGDISIAQYLKEHLLEKIFQHKKFRSETEFAIKQCFEEIEQQLYRKYHHRQKLIGSTALIVLIFSQKLLIANLGDSGVLGRKKQLPQTQKNKKDLNSSEQVQHTNKQLLMCQRHKQKKYQQENEIFLSKFHNLENQRELNNAKQLGAIIVKRGGKLRIGGQIDLSRSFGDFKYKNYKLTNFSSKREKSKNSQQFTLNSHKITSPMPDNFHKGLLSQPQIQSYQRSEFSSLLLGTDGFWSIFSNSSDQFQKKINNIENENLSQSLIDSFLNADDNSTMILLDLAKCKI